MLAPPPAPRSLESVQAAEAAGSTSTVFSLGRNTAIAAICAASETRMRTAALDPVSYRLGRQGRQYWVVCLGAAAALGLGQCPAPPPRFTQTPPPSVPYPHQA